MEDPDYAGYKTLFEVFYVEVRRVIFRLMPRKTSSDVDSLIYLINEYILRKIHKTLWKFGKQESAQDDEYVKKANSVQWITP